MQGYERGEETDEGKGMREERGGRKWGEDVEREMRWSGEPGGKGGG